MDISKIIAIATWIKETNEHLDKIFSHEEREYIDVRFEIRDVYKVSIDLWEPKNPGIVPKQFKLATGIDIYLKDTSDLVYEKERLSNKLDECIQLLMERSDGK